MLCPVTDHLGWQYYVMYYSLITWGGSTMLCYVTDHLGWQYDVILYN